MNTVRGGGGGGTDTYLASDRKRRGTYFQEREKNIRYVRSEGEKKKVVMYLQGTKTRVLTFSKDHLSAAGVTFGVLQREGRWKSDAYKIYVQGNDAK